MRTVALLPHTQKAKALELAARLIDRLARDGIAVWLEKEAAELLGRPDLAGSEAALAHAVFALAIGGDGAFLKAARLAAPHGVPILGVNVGRLGFLTAVEPASVDEAIERLLRGEYEVEERLMLRAVLVREGRPLRSFFGLNDAVVTRGVLARLVELEAYVGTELVGTFVGDGLIVSTPTGSTAYSLSAGGPILHPELQALLLTPICPHTIGARALVTLPNQVVRIRLAHPSGHSKEAMLTVDGQAGEALLPGDEVRVERASMPARLLRLEGRSFYTLVHARLRQGNG